MMDLTFLGRNFSKRDLNQGCLSLPPQSQPTGRHCQPPPGAAASQPKTRQPHTWLIAWEIAVLEDVVLFYQNQILSYFLG
jgi:hypothetical protein